MATKLIQAFQNLNFPRYKRHTFLSIIYIVIGYLPKTQNYITSLQVCFKHFNGFLRHHH